jgi:hypothetical protein
MFAALRLEFEGSRGVYVRGGRGWGDVKYVVLYIHSLYYSTDADNGS